MAPRFGADSYPPRAPFSKTHRWDSRTFSWVQPRGAIFLARPEEQERLQRQGEDLIRRGAKIDIFTSRAALKFCSVVRTDQFALVLYEPDCKDIDTDALMAGYLKSFKRRGGQVVTEARVSGLERFPLRHIQMGILRG